MPDTPLVPSYTKGEVNRAGAHLAARLEAAAERRLDELSEPPDLRARAVIEWWVDEHLEPMGEVQRVVSELAPTVDVDGTELALVTARPKRVATILGKLRREPGKLSQMVDLGGIRAVVETMDDVDDLAERIAAELHVTRRKDWARAPRRSGYRALHLYVRHADRNLEVQLRTWGQDAWANVVEQEGYLSGLDYKSGGGHPEVLEFLRVMADFNAVIELGETHPDVVRRFERTLSTARPLLRLRAFARIEP